MGVETPLIGFGLPWCALGPKSLYSDSGFLLVFEMLKKMKELFGTVSLIMLEPRYKEAFEEKNNQAKTGVWGVYSAVSRVPSRSSEVTIDNPIANDYLAVGKQCPSDFVFTNQRLTVAHQALVTSDRYRRYRVPVYLQPTMSGVENKPVYQGHSKAKVQPVDVHCMAEASAYLMARRVFWVTAEQRRRGIAICRRYLSSAAVRQIRDDHRIIGGGITELVKTHALSDAEVRGRLQTAQEDFYVSFVGRFTSNKRPLFIFDSVAPLFARHNIRLEVVSVGTIDLPAGGYKRLKDGKDAKNIIGFQECGGQKGREYYASTILPRLKCGIHASIMEAHPSTVREGIYVGAPWLLPDKPWSRSMFGDVYPFYYKDEVTLFALVQRIKGGKISDDEVSRFNKCRHDRDMIEFMEDTATKVHACAIKDAREGQDYFDGHNFGRIIDSWTKVVKLGDTFFWRDLNSLLKKGSDGELQGIADRPQARSYQDVFSVLRGRIACLNPLSGLFRRVS